MDNDVQSPLTPGRALKMEKGGQVFVLGESVPRTIDKIIYHVPPQFDLSLEQRRASLEDFIEKVEVKSGEHIFDMSEVSDRPKEYLFEHDPKYVSLKDAIEKKLDTVLKEDGTYYTEDGDYDLIRGTMINVIRSAAVDAFKLVKDDPEKLEYAKKVLTCAAQSMYMSGQLYSPLPSKDRSDKRRYEQITNTPEYAEFVKALVAGPANYDELLGKEFSRKYGPIVLMLRNMVLTGEFKSMGGKDGVDRVAGMDCATEHLMDVFGQVFKIG